MTAVPVAPAAARPVPARPLPLAAAGRLLRLELRRNAMLWMLPVAVALFWLTAYRKSMASPPLWNVRAMTMQAPALLAFVSPVAGAAAWMGSRERRRRTAELVAATARPRWARQLTTWAATTCWAMVAYLGCVAVLYGVTAQQAAWGGPLWWPAVVVAASLPALSALGFAAGTFFPSRFTTPLAAVAAFFALALSTVPIHGSQSYWQISPVVTGPWDIAPAAGVATFYHYLPDLPIAQVMFLTGLTVAVLGMLGLAAGAGGRWLRRAAAAITAAGLVAAGTAVTLTGTGRMDVHGMIAIPALHDAASDRPIRYRPVCSHAAIPVCLNLAYTRYLPAVAAALEPVLSQVAGLPGAPVRISQAAATYQQGSGNNVSIGMAGPRWSGTPPVFHLVLPDQLPGPATTTSGLAAQVRADAGPNILADVIGGGPGASRAQQAVMAALMKAAAVPQPVSLARGARQPAAVLLPAPVSAAAQRFAELPFTARHAWLVRHLAALRAGRITLAQLP
jgi:hypothetical protein